MVLTLAKVFRAHSKRSRDKEVLVTPELVCIVQFRSDTTYNKLLHQNFEKEFKRNVHILQRIWMKLNAFGNANNNYFKTKQSINQFFFFKSIPSTLGIFRTVCWLAHHKYCNLSLVSLYPCDIKNVRLFQKTTLLDLKILYLFGGTLLCSKND